MATLWDVRRRTQNTKPKEVVLQVGWGRRKPWRDPLVMFYRKVCSSLPGDHPCWPGIVQCPAKTMYARQCQTILDDAIQCHTIPDNAIQCHTMPNNAKKCQTIPDNVRQYQTMPVNASLCLPEDHPWWPVIVQYPGKTGRDDKDFSSFLTSPHTGPCHLTLLKSPDITPYSNSGLTLYFLM